MQCWQATKSFPVEVTYIWEGIHEIDNHTAQKFKLLFKQCHAAALPYCCGSSNNFQFTDATLIEKGLEKNIAALLAAFRRRHFEMTAAAAVAAEGPQS